jgi:universal stress protein E
MHRFRKILYVLDPDARDASALVRAIGLARRNGDRLTALEIKSGRRGEESVALTSLLDAHTTAGDEVEIRSRTASGPLWAEITAEVAAGGHDLVIKSADPTALGSTNVQLLRKCPAPVWLVRQGETGGCRSVLAAVDPEREEKADLNRMIVELAASLAANEGAVLHLVHGWELPGEQTIRSPLANVPLPRLDAMQRETRNSRLAAVDSLLRSADIGTVSLAIHFRKGDPGDVIAAVAEEQRADLVVAGTVGRSGVAAWLLGNTAEQLVARLHCSVLAVKPASFGSPAEAGV